MILTGFLEKEKHKQVFEWYSLTFTLTNTLPALEIIKCQNVPWIGIMVRHVYQGFHNGKMKSVYNYILYGTNV